jgi:hypothetical protein
MGFIGSWERHAPDRTKQRGERLSAEFGNLSHSHLDLTMGGPCRNDTTERERIAVERG